MFRNKTNLTLNLFDDIPDELILRIFIKIAKREEVGFDPVRPSSQAIAQLSAVDKRFNRIANDDSIQFRLTPSFYSPSKQINGNLQAYKINALFGKLYSQIAYDNLEKVKTLFSLKLIDASAIYPDSSVGAGGTFLHTAAAHCSRTSALYLIEQGARIDTTDKQGKTSLDVAKGYLLDATTREEKSEPFFQQRAAKLSGMVDLLEKAQLLEKTKDTKPSANIKDAKASITTSTSAFFTFRPEIIASQEVLEPIKNKTLSPI